jgi:hypothetical protein
MASLCPSVSNNEPGKYMQADVNVERLCKIEMKLCASHLLVMKCQGWRKCHFDTRLVPGSLNCFFKKTPVLNVMFSYSHLILEINSLGHMTTITRPYLRYCH